MKNSLLTIEQLAEYLNVSVRTVNNIKKSGKIGFIMVGHSVRFRPEDIKKYEADNEVPPK